jgi:hypothetical protein
VSDRERLDDAVLQMNTRFAIAVHVLTFLHTQRGVPATSEPMAPDNLGPGFPPLAATSPAVPGAR